MNDFTNDELLGLNTGNEENMADEAVDNADIRESEESETAAFEQENTDVLNTAAESGSNSAEESPAEPLETGKEEKTGDGEPTDSVTYDTPAVRKKGRVKVKKERGQKPFMVKVLAAAVIGLTFGIFTAGGFYGVNQLLGDKVSIEKDDSKEIEEIRKDIADLQKTVHVNTNSTGSTVVNTTNSDVTAVVDKVMPSMVSVGNIYDEVTYYWGRKYAQEREANGSGIIIGENEKEYLIATNYHVIEDNKLLTIQFVDASEAEAYVKGYDSAMDIAVIAVSKESLDASTEKAIAVAELGDSDSLKMGETAIAIGNALGYGQSVTTGVISALDREIDLENSVSDLIQTSAAINPGNSGGALLNIAGQVIGINSSKIGSTTVEGMGFAIPINEVKDIIVEFSNRETKDKVSEEKRGYLGISGKSVSETGLSDLGFPDGVYINEVFAGSAAEQAGIFAGDIVTKANGQSLKSIEELQEMLSYYSSGETVTFQIIRRVDGEFDELNIDVLLGDRSAIDAAEKKEEK